MGQNWAKANNRRQDDRNLGEIGILPNMKLKIISPLNKDSEKISQKIEMQNDTAIGFLLEGHYYPAKSAREVLKGVFEVLAKRDETILERFASLPKHGRTRRYLAKDPVDLYPGRPDLARDFSAQLSSGWWLGTNNSRATIEQIIVMVCEVAHLKYGKDLSVNLGE